MDSERVVRDEWQCIKTMTRFFNSLDDRHFEDLADCMTESGVWVRQGKPLEGRSAVLSALAERSPTVLTRHLISNPVAKIEGEAAEVTAVVTIFHHDDGSGTQPGSLSLPRAILRFTAVMGCSNEGWQIRRLTSERLFAQ